MIKLKIPYKKTLEHLVEYREWEADWVPLMPISFYLFKQQQRNIDSRRPSPDR